MATPKHHILMTGGSGLVGSRLKELLSQVFTIESFGISGGFDITNKQTLAPILGFPKGSVVLHLAAKADVDGCEKDTPFGEDGDAWKINVLGTENMLRVCEVALYKMIYVSTDFVFDGETTPQGGYTEADKPNPINWYAKTKYEGEKLTLESSGPHVIMRIAYPYRAHFEEKVDFVRAIGSRLKQNLEVKAVVDHVMTPTFIDDIATGIQALVEHNAEGIYHVVGSSSHSPYDAALMIAKALEIADPKIVKVTRGEFFKDRAPRPFDLTLKNGKIKQLGVWMKTFEEGLKIISNF